MSMSKLFDQWTVYDHPRDFPNCYVARRFEHDPDSNEYRKTEDLIVGADLELIRYALLMKGLAMVPRFPGDDPVILETWL